MERGGAVTELKEQTRARRKAARPMTMVMLVVFFLATAAAQQGILDYRFPGEAPMSGGTASDTSLSAMPSFATALLLGGLRGPLVMTLWISSETQKQRNDLEDIDTKIEWIRLLQPEFDAVHLFQIWNKAYNISVKMTSLANKYSTVIDAIDYGQKVDRERPDDSNILAALAQVYSDKLGASQENAYYRQRVRRETQTLFYLRFPASLVDQFRAAAPQLGWNREEAPLGLDQKTNTYTVLLEKPLAGRLVRELGQDATIQAQTPEEAASINRSWRRMRLPPMLDADGNILPNLLAERFPRPAGVAEDQPWYDGSQLQMLKSYQPFPFGISTFALAYNDYKRAQLLLAVWKERMLQSNDMAIDSRPGIMLKLWAQDDWQRGRRAEIKSLGGASGTIAEPLDLEVPDGQIPLSMKILNPEAYDLAIYSYGSAARVFADARTEFNRHIHNDPTNAYNYFSHVDDTIAMEHLMLADRDYLEAIGATAERRQQLMKSALERYTVAQEGFALVLLKYFMEDRVAQKVFPIDPATRKPRSRLTIEQAPPATWVPTAIAAVQETQRIYTDPDTGQLIAGDMNQDERHEYLDYLQHCEERIDLLKAALTPQTAPSNGR
jgi:hypothetical protein